MNNKKIEQILNNVKTTLAVEGLEVTKFSEELVRKVLKGEITSDEAIEMIKNYHLKERE